MNPVRSTCTRNRPKRKPLPAHLPRKTIVHYIEDKTCDYCGHDLHRIGEEKSEQLEFIPAQVKVIEHVRPKYCCRHCEKTGTEVRIKIAPAPKSPIPKSLATASLLAHIITSKYQYALPLYRQEQMFRQFYIDLNRKIRNNLTPYIAQVASGKLPHLNVFGKDYPSSDGTGIRDYIHVMDLVEEHLATLNYLAKNPGWHVFNFGTGNGFSVLDIVNSFERTTGQSVPYRIVERRAGDIAACYADTAKAAKNLAWKTRRSLDEMCQNT